MLFRVLADITVCVHLLWVLFLIAGSYWGRRYRKVMPVHAAGLAFAIVSQIAGWYCPLTFLEVWFRQQQAASQGYAGSFIAYYAERLVYLDLSPVVIFLLTLLLLGINAWVYRRPFARKDRMSS